MPLPGGNILGLLGHSRPGDALHSKPKQAMIVRMSAETLEALQATPHPQMKFEFGPHPGIHIGDSFFSMRPQKEASPHEIYLRNASAARPGVPLKYYADVTGKFIVQRQLGEDVQETIRERTKGAEQQRLERKAILLDAPPAVANSRGAKKAKEVAPIRKTAPAPRRALAPPASSQPSRIGSPLPPTQSISGDSGKSLRNRLIRCLAVSPRTTESVTRMMYGPAADVSAHPELLDLLNEIAEVPGSDRAGGDLAGLWKLKIQTWTEVRPYDWQKMGEQERMGVARKARLAFSDLKIPESDPLWDHVRYRSMVQLPQPVASSSRSESQAPAVKVEQKKPAMPKEKAKAAPRKKDTTIMAKDEGSSRASSSVIPAKNESRQPAVPVKAEPVTAPLPPKPARRLPGSGFKAKPSPTPPNASPTATAPPKRLGPADARESKKEPSAPSGSARPTAPIPSQAKTNPVPKSAVTKAKDSHDSDTSAASVAVKRKRIPKQEEGELFEPPPPSGNIKKKRKLEEGTLTKEQKSAKHEEGELLEPAPSGGVKKKRKMEDGTPVPIPDHLAPSKRMATREPSPLSKPVSKEPPQQPLTARERADSVSKSSSSKSTSAEPPKFKRGRDIYTSSEDEADRAQHQQASQTKPSHSSANAAGKKKDNNQHQRPRAPLPKDVVGLRKRYKSTYLPYILTYQKVITEKTKIENALSGTLTDSDGDVDFMDVDNLTKLTEEHKLYKDELESIQAAYTKAGGGLLKGEGSSSSD